jgi:hypothetical protein
MTSHAKIKYLPRWPQNTQVNAMRNSYFWLELECQHCGEMFKSKRIHKQFCSGRCRVAAHRAKVAACVVSE